jgi:hypothetical protein
MTALVSGQPDLVCQQVAGIFLGCLLNEHLRLLDVARECQGEGAVWNRGEGGVSDKGIVRERKRLVQVLLGFFVPPEGSLPQGL